MKRVFLLYFISFSLFAQAQVVVKNLLVEQQASPIGIATLQPRFSWQIESDKNNIKQIAYEILVASSKANLENNIGDLWTSGKINSDATVLIPYYGKALQSNQYYYVKVKSITDNDGEVWSKPMFFTVGFVSSSNWKAKWIGYDKAFPWDSVSQWSRLSARYYRKEFITTKKLKKAFVNIVGLGMYELMINGKKMGDKVLTPAPTDYRKSVLSNTYDVTEHILSGKNAIGVVLGNGRFFTMRQNYKTHKINNFGFPKVLCQLDLLYDDGSRETVASDQSWKFTADGPIRTNNEYDGEEYDATKELGDWSMVGYNDGKWLKPQLVVEPTSKILPQPNQSMKVMQKMKPLSVKHLKGDAYILDMGQNFSGWLQIKVKGNKGDKVKMRFAESLEKDGSLYVANLRDAHVTDVYTLKGAGEEIWHPVFVYHGFRYVEVSGWPGTPSIDDFEGHLVYDNIHTTGSLITSNETINQILKNAWWGIASNYKGMPVDCPQRNERQPWLGDRAQGAYGESFLFNNEALYSKWLDDIQQSQTPEGAIPDVTPAYWNYYSDNMTWPGVYLLVAEMLYNQYGDRQAIVKHYPYMKKWLGYMKGKYLKNNIMTKDKYGDWCVPPEDLKMIKSQDSTRTTNGQLIATAYYYHFLQMMKQFANLSGNTSDIVEYDQIAAKVKDAFNSKFFKQDKGLYENGTITANLLPLYFGMVSPQKAAQVFANIYQKLQKDNMHISTGVIGTQWLMRGLTEFGKPQAAFTLASNDTYPSWGYMAKQGATTIWELWNGNTANPQMNSQNHIMLLGDLLVWLYENVAGIKAASPGFKQIMMRPSFDAGIGNVNATYQSVYGKISSSWSNNNGKLKWNISIPANTSALVYIPVGEKVVSAADISKVIECADGAQFVEVKDRNAIFKVGSGEYEFIKK